MSAPAIAYWAFNYRPHWEAASKEVQTLSEAMRGRFRVCLHSFSFGEVRPRIRGPHKHFPLPLCLPMLPLIARRAHRYAVNHLFASPNERVLAPRLVRAPAILTLAKDATSVAGFERNLETLRRFRFIVVECDRHRELLRQLALPEESVRLIRPGVEVRPYRPNDGPFSILFATSPMSRYGFLSRGIFLLIAAAKRLPDVRFVLVWRQSQIGRLRRLLGQAGVPNVEVRNGYIDDMGAVYRSVDATILPGIEPGSLKPCPHSALESLAHGKPVLVSEPTSLAPLVARNGCGVVFAPTVDALEEAVRRLHGDYAQLQARCHSTIERHFARSEFLARYRRLYEAML